MDELYQSLAELVLEHLHGRLSAEEEACLDHAARYSLKRRVTGYTSMLQEFARPIGLARQVGPVLRKLQPSAKYGPVKRH